MHLCSIISNRRIINVLVTMTMMMMMVKYVMFYTRIVKQFLLAKLNTNSWVTNDSVVVFDGVPVPWYFTDDCLLRYHQLTEITRKHSLEVTPTMLATRPWVLGCLLLTYFCQLKSEPYHTISNRGRRTWTFIQSEGLNLIHIQELVYLIR